MNEPVLNDELIQSILASQARGETVRKRLADGGRLHLDRQLPFLCLYRQPTHKDVGTIRLVLGEAAYLLIPRDTPQFDAYRSLIKGIARQQKQDFGAFLLFEMWADESGFDDLMPQQPGFHIHARVDKPPVRLLETLESELLEFEVAGQTPVIRLSYEKAISPPQLSPLFTDEELQQLATTVLGLQLRPIYRDDESGELFPFEQKQLHQGITHALKQAFYRFALTYTSHRPAHYQELGPRAITPSVKESDRSLAEISNNFDLLLHVSPVNAPEAWEQFSNSGFKRIPEFLYRPRTVDPDLLKRRLYQIPIERIEDPTLAHIFTVKREELDRQINLVAERGTNRFLLASRILYGDVETSLLALAKEMLASIDSDSDTESSDSLKAEDFARHAQAEVDYYRQQQPELATRIILRDDVPGIMVSRGDFLIGRDTVINANRIRATLAHEIGTHVITHFNGKRQPFQELYAGMAGYEPMQEGLAVVGEYLVGELGVSRLRLLAGRVVAANMIIAGADFLETFQQLCESYNFPPYTAYTITMRIFRGGGYIKDVVYLRGLVRILDYIARGKALESLYVGKLSHDYLHLIEELQWRKVVKPAELLPRFLQEKDAQMRLKRLQQGMTVFDLIKEVV